VRSFLAPKSRVFLLVFLAREVQKRETGSIRSDGDLRVDLEVLVWILGFRVHLNLRVSHFLL